jgi:hypothetical protein
MSNVLRQTTFYKFLIKLGRNVMCHSILPNALRQTNFYKLIDHT